MAMVMLIERRVSTPATAAASMEMRVGGRRQINEQRQQSADESDKSGEWKVLPRVARGHHAVSERVECVRHDVDE